MNQTPERFELERNSSEFNNNQVNFLDEHGGVRLPSIQNHRGEQLDSNEKVRTGIGADFAQRPQMALR